MSGASTLQAARVLTRDGVFTDDPWPLVAPDAEAPDTDAVLLPLAAYL